MTWCGQDLGISALHVTGPGEAAAVSLSFLDRGYQTLPRPEGAPIHSAATLRILASMPSRTIGEWDPLPLL